MPEAYEKIVLFLNNYKLMGVVSWLGFGLAAGVTAKLLLPGSENMGWLRTIAIGVAGSFIGAALAAYLGFGKFAQWSFLGFVSAVAGAILLLLLNRLVTRT